MLKVLTVLRVRVPKVLAVLRVRVPKVLAVLRVLGVLQHHGTRCTFLHIKHP